MKSIFFFSKTCPMSAVFLVIKKIFTIFLCLVDFFLVFFDNLVPKIGNFLGIYQSSIKILLFSKFLLVLDFLCFEIICPVRCFWDFFFFRVKDLSYFKYCLVGGLLLCRRKLPVVQFYIKQFKYILIV